MTDPQSCIKKVLAVKMSVHNVFLNDSAQSGQDDHSMIVPLNIPFGICGIQNQLHEIRLGIRDSRCPKPLCFQVGLNKS